MAKALALDHLQVAMPRGEEAAARNFYGVILGKQLFLKRTLVTALIFICSVLVYIVGIEAELGPIILVGLVLEMWCLVRAGRRRPPRV